MNNITTTYQQVIDHQAISLEKWIIKRERRRRRVAKRMAARFPMFAVEFMQKEFPGYTPEQFAQDIKPAKHSRPAKKRKGKSQLRRQGRYPLYEKAMTNYRHTGNQDYLLEAQQWRNKMFLPMEVHFRLGTEKQVHTFPSTTPVRLIQELVAIKFESWEELERILEEKLRWSHIE